MLHRTRAQGSGLTERNILRFSRITMSGSKPEVCAESGLAEAAARLSIAATGADLCSELQYTLALSLLKELCRDEKENFVISPLSLGMSLAMLTAGSRGKTQTELLQLFGATDENELHSLYSTLLSEKNLPLKLANKYLATVNMRIHPKFESLLKVSFSSALERGCEAPNPFLRS